MICADGNLFSAMAEAAKRKEQVEREGEAVTAEVTTQGRGTSGTTVCVSGTKAALRNHNKMICPATSSIDEMFAHRL